MWRMCLNSANKTFKILKSQDNITTEDLYRNSLSALSRDAFSAAYVHRNIITKQQQRMQLQTMMIS